MLDMYMRLFICCFSRLAVCAIIFALKLTDRYTQNNHYYRMHYFNFPSIFTYPSTFTYFLMIEDDVMMLWSIKALWYYFFICAEREGVQSRVSLPVFPLLSHPLPLPSLPSSPNSSLHRAASTIRPAGAWRGCVSGCGLADCGSRGERRSSMEPAILL